MDVQPRSRFQEIRQALAGTLVGFAVMLLGVGLVLPVLVAPNAFLFVLAIMGLAFEFMGLILFFSWGFVVLPAAIRGDH